LKKKSTPGTNTGKNCRQELIFFSHLFVNLWASRWGKIYNSFFCFCF